VKNRRVFGRLGSGFLSGWSGGSGIFKVVFKERKRERNSKSCIQIPEREEKGGQIRLLLAYFFGEVRVFEVGIFVVVDGEAACGVVCVAPDLAGDFEGGLVVGALEGEVLQATGENPPLFNACRSPSFSFLLHFLSSLQAATEMAGGKDAGIEKGRRTLALDHGWSEVRQKLAGDD
jgi:hypothetical protein